MVLRTSSPARAWRPAAAARLARTLGLMFTPLPSDISTPDDDTVLWRYMDLPKLLALLGTSSLYLSRLDQLMDKYEGTWPKTTLAAASTNWPRSNFDFFTSITAAMRAAHFVSCWCASPRESSSHWGTYAGPHGIALVTSVAALKASVLAGVRFYIGEIEYLDFANAPPQNLNLYRPAFLKRAEFESEREVRVLVSTLGPEQQNGVTPFPRTVHRFSVSS